MTRGNSRYAEKRIDSGDGCKAGPVGFGERLDMGDDRIGGIMSECSGAGGEVYSMDIPV